MLDLTQAKQDLAKAPARNPSFHAERLRLLLLHSKDFYRQNPKQAEAWAREALALATKLRDAEAVAGAHYRIGCANFQLSNFPEAIAEFQHAIQLDRPSEFQTPLLEGPIFMLGLALAQQGNYAQAIQQYDRALQLSRKNQRKSEIDILSALGNAALEQGDYSKALKYQYESLAILDAQDDSLRRSVVLSNIGRIYLDVQDLQKADLFFQRAYVLGKELNDHSGLASILANRGIISQSENHLTKASAFYSEASANAKKAARNDIECYIAERHGQLQLTQSKPKIALEYFDRAIEESKALNFRTIWTASLIGKGRALLALQKPAEGIKSLNESLRMCEESGLLPLECECVSALAMAYEAAGKLRESVQYFNRFIELNSKVHSEQKQRELVEISARVEIEKADRERARMETIARDASARAELLRAESERQSKELTTLALQLVERNEFLCDLKEEIEPAIKSPRKAKEISDRIDEHIRSDRDWETFEHQFDQVNRDFLKALATQFPTLTPTELKITVFIKLNLSTKAIASLLCLSPRTVENHRLSIRRKLGLSAEDNLVSFLTGFGKQ